MGTFWGLQDFMQGLGLLGLQVLERKNRETITRLYARIREGILCRSTRVVMCNRFGKVSGVCNANVTAES